MNKIEGKSLWESMTTNIDMKSIGVSAITGAAGAGLADKIGKLGKLTQIAANALMDGGSNIAAQMATTGKVDLKQTAVAVGTGYGFGKVFSSKAAAATETKIAEKELDRTLRVASKEGAREGKKKAVNTAQKKVSNEKYLKPQLKTAIVTPVVNKGYEAATNDTKKK